MKHVFKTTAILLLLFGNSIAQGLAEQVQATQQQQQDSAAIQWQPPTQDATPTPPATTVPTASVQQPVPVATAKRLTYELLLDSLDILATSLLPGREKLDSMKKSINAEVPNPKGEYEKQAVYEERLANFEKAKQQKILKLETDLKAEEKKTVDNINSSIKSKTDIQPEWNGMLKFDANAEEYKERSKKIAGKIPEVQKKVDKIYKLLNDLNFDPKSIEMFVKKNQIYFLRLEKAQELMQDYVVQDQAKILTTPKKKTEMSLGSYDPEKEEFQISANDTSSKTVPFDYSGTIKITPEEAQAINRKTDDFTASIDYINYPFITNDAKLYPGAVKAHVFYKDKEVLTNGMFKVISGYEKIDGYVEWAIYADSIISGKLAPKKWDSLYAMQPKQIESNISESSSGESFWTKKTVLRTAMFGLAGASFGLGIWQNSKMKSETKTAERLYSEASDAKKAQNESLFQQKKAAYEKSIDNFNKSENFRNGFYIGAGVFGIAGIATFFF